jgi:hypothetical protein
MRKQYNGLKAVMIPIENSIITSGPCVAMIQLEMQNGICISDELWQQIEYVGDKG